MSEVPSLPHLIFDRATGRLAHANLAERGAIVTLRNGARLSGAFAHRGYSLGCRLVATAVPLRREVIFRLNADANFIVPLADGYWSLLLDRAFVYEPEIEQFLLSVAEVDYTFVDCGANFGYWSVLASSAPFGGHKCIAIEASALNAARLQHNADLNGARFTVLHLAVAAESGTCAFVHGRKHEALYVTATDEAHDGEPVKTISLDDLVAHGLLAATGRSVIKLDVEGAEINSLKGARGLLHGETIVVCEEHGADRNHTVSRFILGETRCRLFMLDPASGRFERCTDLAVLDRIKSDRSTGYNVFATASAFWEQRILGAANAGDAGRQLAAE